MIKEIDLWVLDNLFQPIVDWGNRQLDVTKSSFLVGVFCLFGAALFFHLYLHISEGVVPLINVLVAIVYFIWGPDYISTVVRNSEKEEKGGFESEFRSNPISIMTRVLYLFLVGFATFETLVIETSMLALVELMMFFCLWAFFCFRACKNKPPMFKKKALASAH